VVLFEAEPAHLNVGSRALCMQRETLEIWARLGIGEEVAARGVQWELGRTYFRDRELFQTHLPANPDDHFPPFVNISQTEVEQLLLDRLADLGVRPRGGHRLIGLEQDSDGVELTFETDAHRTTFQAAYAVGADGAHSGVRHALGLEFRGHSFEDLFLIADVRAELPFPAERRFFFDPPGNPGRQVLIHPQPDGIWRIDWQLPPGADAEAIDRRVRAVIGPEAAYEVVWLTTYRFSQRLVDRFRVGRVFLAGDAAHLMAPFGARGLNSGVADAENLAWKLARVLTGRASDHLLDSFDAERRPAAVENLAVTEETMRFMVPRGWWRRAWRNLVLGASVRSRWFRRRVNSGRLAEPFSYAGAPGPQDRSLPRHGAVAPDGPLGDGRLRDRLGRDFVVLLVGVEGPPVDVGCEVLVAGAELAVRYGSQPRAWLIRPDGHVADSLPLSSDGQLAELPAFVARGTPAGARDYYPR
jgi:3-(3-hydroxy-phenyl)propionate hydroxylase